MATIDKLTRYCTEEQTIKSYGLGVCLSFAPNDFFAEKTSVCIDGELYSIPTTQQMIEWFAINEGIYIDTIGAFNDDTMSMECYTYTIAERGKRGTYFCEWTYASKLEAEYAAINRALDILQKRKDEERKTDELIYGLCKDAYNALSEDKKEHVASLIKEKKIIRATRFITKETKCGSKTAKTLCDMYDELKSKKII